MSHVMKISNQTYSWNNQANLLLKNCFYLVSRITPNLLGVIRVTFKGFNKPIHTSTSIYSMFSWCLPPLVRNVFVVFTPIGT